MKNNAAVMSVWKTEQNSVVHLWDSKRPDYYHVAQEHQIKESRDENLIKCASNSLSSFLQ